MILFLAFSVPLLWCFLAFARWERELAPDRLAWFLVFLRGLLSGIVGLAVLTLLRSIVGFSWRPRSMLFVSVLLSDHLAPVLLAVGAMIPLLRRITASHRGAALFLAVSSFLCGWFTVSGLAEAVSSWGRGDPYALIVMPLLRVAEILAVCLWVTRFHPWEGRDRVLALLAAAGICLAAAGPSFLYQAARRGMASILAALASAAVLAVLATRFPMVFLQGASGGRPPLNPRRRSPPPAGRTGPGRRV